MSETFCEVPGCTNTGEKHPLRRGLCTRHYFRAFANAGTQLKNLYRKDFDRIFSEVVAEMKGRAA